MKHTHTQQRTQLSWQVSRHSIHLLFTANVLEQQEVKDELQIDVLYEEGQTSGFIFSSRVFDLNLLVFLYVTVRNRFEANETDAFDLWFLKFTR